MSGKKKLLLGFIDREKPLTWIIAIIISMLVNSSGCNFGTLLWYAMKLVNDKDIIKSLNNFKQKPFDYCIIDNFFPTKISNELSNRFPKYSAKFGILIKIR